MDSIHLLLGTVLIDLPLKYCHLSFLISLIHLPPSSPAVSIFLSRVFFHQILLTLFLLSCLIWPSWHIDGVSDIILSEDSDIALFADDIVLFKPIRYASDYTVLRNDINNLSSWVVNNYLEFNIPKCKAMVFALFLYRLCILMMLTTFWIVCRSFSIIFTSNLSWSTHVNHVCSKGKKLIGMLLRKFSGFCDTVTLRQLYIRPHLEFASVIWSPHFRKYKFVRKRSKICL